MPEVLVFARTSSTIFYQSLIQRSLHEIIFEAFDAKPII